MKPYKGELSLPQIAEGMNLARSNATRLVEDAELLFGAARYPTAAALAVLSIEESGKMGILRRFVLSNQDKGPAALWKDYRAHTEKNRGWIVSDLVNEDANKLDDFNHIYAKDAPHTKLLDQFKQLGLYTDCVEGGVWTSPHEIADRSIAQMLITNARHSLPIRETTVLELELWAKHLGPVVGPDIAPMKAAVCAWYSDMQENGLVPSGGNLMEIFINEGVKGEHLALLGLKGVDVPAL